MSFGYLERKVSLQELLTAHPSSFVKFSALWSATSKITFCISKFILKSSLIAFFSKMDLNIFQSVRPTGSFSALCILCELYRCTAQRLSLVTSEPLQLSMHSHQGIDTDITQDQRVDCDRKVIKGQNLYTPLRKGEQGHKWLTWQSDVPSRPSHPLIFPGTCAEDGRCSPMILLPPLDIFISCAVASRRRSLLLSLAGDILGHVAATKSLFWLLNKKCSLLNDTSNNQLQLLVNNLRTSYAWTGLVWFLVPGVALVEPAGLERGTRKSGKTDFIQSVTGEWKTNKFNFGRTYCQLCCCLGINIWVNVNIAHFNHYSYIIILCGWFSKICSTFLKAPHWVCSEICFWRAGTRTTVTLTLSTYL